MANPAVQELRLIWHAYENKVVCYSLWSLDENDQLAWCADYEQGPFDTALDVAQWAWRAIARQVPAAHC